MGLVRAVMVWSLWALFFPTFSMSIRGVSPSETDKYPSDGASGSFACLDGSGLIVGSRVNDDFCDCVDGSDEPGTSACSNGRFHCPNKGFKPKSLPSSRVNDGLCDCCDGSDEWGSGECVDTCTEKALEAYKDQIDQIEILKKGILVKNRLMEEGKKLVDEKKSILDEASGHKESIQKRLQEAKAIRDALETKEAPVSSSDTESGGLDEGDYEGDDDVDVLIQDDPDQHPEQNFPYPEQYAAPPEAEGDDTENEEAFPYPKEYAAPGSGSDSGSATATGSDSDTVSDQPSDQGEAEDFPYPKEYAAPPDAEDQASDPPEPLDSEPAEAESEPESQQQGEGETEPSESQELIDARVAVSELEKELREWEDKSRDADKILNQVGNNIALIPMYEKCFDRKVRQYTYQVCLFGDAHQKEGSSSTRLGSFQRITQDGNKLYLEYSGGQTCWNGPQRSIKVSVECGAENELGHVDEPSKCVYATTLKTPAVCEEEKLQELEKLVSDLKN